MRNIDIIMAEWNERGKSKGEPETKASITETSTAKVIELPLWSDEKRGIPNEMVRSALFNVRNRRQRREYFEDTPIIVVGEGQITYRGQELRQDDEDVWLHVMHLARLQSLGKWVEFTPYSMLKALGWPLKGQSYERLRNCLGRMQATALSVYSKRLKEGISVSLVRKFEWKDKDGIQLGRWRVWIEPEMKVLFGDVYYTRLEWEQRKQLGPIARWLHGIYTSHAKPFPMKVETIWQGSGSSTRLRKHFKEKLVRALDELKKIGFLEEWQIDSNDLVHIVRANRRLRKKP